MSSIIYDLAIVEDRGTHWVVVNVTKNTYDAFVDKHEKLLKLSFIAYQQIKQALSENKLVRISKSMRSNEVIPGEYEIVDTGTLDPLSDVKDASIRKVRMLVTPEMTKIACITMYGFIILNNDLVNNGFAITNDNREEKYLQILETGNEELIQKLEDYLNYKDEIESVAQLERKFSKYRTDIKQAQTPEQVNDLENAFLERFYSSY